MIDLELYIVELSKVYGIRPNLEMVAQLLNCDVRTVRRREADGLIPRRGADGCFSLAQLVEWLENGPAAGDMEKKPLRRGRIQQMKKRVITAGW